jgi:predicted trehalose synthase
LGTVPNGTRKDVRHFGTQAFAPIAEKLSQISELPGTPHESEFGMVGALCQNMMPQLIETLEHDHRPHCSREQARELLEALRAAYRALPSAERTFVKSVIGRAQHAQAMQDID